MSKFFLKYKMMLLVVILSFLGSLFFINMAKAETPVYSCSTDKEIIIDGQEISFPNGFVFIISDDPNFNIFENYNTDLRIICLYATNPEKKIFDWDDFFKWAEPNSYFESIKTNRSTWDSNSYAVEDLLNESRWTWDEDVISDGRVVDAKFETDRKKRIWVKYKDGGLTKKMYIYYFGPGRSQNTSGDEVIYEGSQRKSSLSYNTWGYFGSKYKVINPTGFSGPYTCSGACTYNDRYHEGFNIDTKNGTECKIEEDPTVKGKGTVTLKVVPSKMTGLFDRFHNNIGTKFALNCFVNILASDSKKSNLYAIDIDIILQKCESLTQDVCNNSQELGLCKWGWDVNKVEYGCIDYASGSTPVDAPISTPATVERERIPMPPGYKGPLPECAFNGSCDNVNDFLELAINVGKWLFSFIGGLAFVFFVYGGFTMILSFGSAEKFKKGQQILVAAVIGMIIAFGAYALVKFLLESIGVQESWIGLIYTK